jgi:serine protease Do
MTDSMRWNRPDIDVHVEPWIEPGAIANLTDRIVSNIRIPASWLDAELVTLNPELGEYFGTTKGILVVRAPREGTLGLRSGDVILSIGGREPSSPSHALRILRSYEAGERVNIEVMREKRRQTVTATVPERDH